MKKPRRKQVRDETMKLLTENGLTGWKVRFNPRLTRALGRCIASQKTIEYQPKFMELNDWDEVVMTIRHEPSARNCAGFTQTPIKDNRGSRRHLHMGHQIMSASVVNRVILPDGGKMYISDDAQGDQRAAEIYKKYGNCKLEACNKNSGKSLDELEPFWTGTIEEQYA